MDKWRYFLGASILVGGLLLKVGAPLEAVVAGIVLGGISVWKLEHLARRSAK